MGSVKIDLYKRRVLYDQAFDLSTSDGVMNFLRCYHELKARRREGDMEAAILLIDFNKAWENDNGLLTPREREVLYLVYNRCLTKREAAERLGITVQTVKTHEEKAARKLASLIGGEGHERSTGKNQSEQTNKSATRTKTKARTSRKATPSG